MPVATRVRQYSRRSEWHKLEQVGQHASAQEEGRRRSASQASKADCAIACGASRARHEDVLWMSSEAVEQREGVPALLTNVRCWAEGRPFT